MATGSAHLHPVAGLKYPKTRAELDDYQRDRIARRATVVRNLANDTSLTNRFMLNTLSMFVTLFDEMDDLLHTIETQKRVQVAFSSVEEQEAFNASIARWEALSVVEFGQMPGGPPSVQKVCKHA